MSLRQIAWRGGACLAALALVSGCAIKFHNAIDNGQNSTADNANTQDSGTPASSATLSLLFPDLLSDRLGYVKWFYGECSHAGNAVEIYSGSTLLGSGLCTGLRFSIYADTSTLAAGNHTLTLKHADSAGLVRSVSTGTLNKFTTACDTLANRQNNFAAGMAGGAGTASNPYIVCTSNQMADMASRDAAYFSLGNDIYFSRGDTNGDNVADGSDTDFVTGAGWAPLTSAWCCGHLTGFYGNRFAIEGLTINRPTTDNIGLFWASAHAFYRSLRFYDVSITGQDHTGVLSGNFSSYSTAYDIHVKSLRATSEINGRSYTGGIIGRAEATALLANLSVHADVTGTSTYTGGIVGRMASGGVHHSKMVGSVTGTSQTGGLIGSIDTGVNVTNSYSTATVSGTASVGGIVGDIKTVLFLENVYNTGNVTGTGDYVGGLVGEAWTGEIRNSFSTGDVQGASATDEIGLLIGNNSFAGSALTLTDAYVSSSATCTDTNAGGGTCNSEGTSTSEDNFVTAGAAELAGWDFEDNADADGANDVWHFSEANTLPKLYFEKNQSDYAVPFSGAGTVADPYLITNATDFGKIRSNPRYAEAAFELTANIDLDDVSAFEPLFRSGVFLGDFDGGDFKLANFSYTESHRAGTGLFHHVDGAKIHDLTVTVSGNVRTSGVMNYQGMIGALSAFLLGDATVSRVKIDGVGAVAMPANSSVAGGICGYCTATISRSSVEIAINGGTAAFVGGLVGYAVNTFIDNSFHSGSVTGGTQVGGLGGALTYTTTIDRSYHLGTVTASGSEVGGISGQNWGVTVTNSYANGNVTGNAGTALVSRLFGHAAGLTADASNYYYTGDSCTNTGGGGCNTTHGTSSGTIADFYTPGSNPVVNWDFATIWQDNSGTSAYPTLQ